MRRLTAVLLVALTLPLVPPASATSASAVAAAPDGDGGFVLTYDVTRAEVGQAALALDVTRDDGDSLARETRELPAVRFEAGTSRWNVSYLPALGPGDYQAQLVVDGVASDPLAFSVADDGGDAALAFVVPDEPTFVNLTSDSVNADGKLKDPGQALLTRATISDGNGLSELDAPTFRVERLDGSPWTDAGLVPWSVGAASTSASVEASYARSPLAAGSYRLTILATKGGAPVANASRSFTIRDVAPTLEPLALPNVAPDADSVRTASVVIDDRNGAPGVEALEARVFRGSARAEGAGFNATFENGASTTPLGAGHPLADGEGFGRTAFPLRLFVPARAAVGAYRVSMYANGTLLGSGAFNVTALPTLVDVHATSDASSLHLDVSGTGDGTVSLVAIDARGASTGATAAFRNGTATLDLRAPAYAGPLRWTLTLAARDDGLALDARNGTWARAEPGLALVALAPRRGAGAWRIDAPGWDLAGATANVTVVRWDGAPAERAHATFEDGIARVALPADAPAGRYPCAVVLTLANGTVARATWSFEAGPWLRVQLGAANVSGREARIPIANLGGVPVRRLVVEAEGVDDLSIDGAPAPVSARGRVVFSGLDVEPATTATLVARLPDGPLAAGAHAARLRVVALAGSG